MEAGVNEGAPLIHDGVMFLPNPDDVVQAIDAASGELLWQYRRTLPPQEKFLSHYWGQRKRSIFLYKDRIYLVTKDNFVLALDARTGKEVWQTDRGGDLYITNTTGPIVVNGVVIAGSNCQDAPLTCYVTGHDAETGKELWRNYVVPKKGEPGDETWGGIPYDQRKHVGTWMPPSYDPELNLLYIGTSVTSPAPKFQLAGNDKRYLYHNSTLAINADTGKLVWYYQHVVDHWDLDHPFERILVDTAVAPDPSEVSWINSKIKKGERRKVITGIPGKTGIVYTLDRRTGEFLWARPTNFQNVVSKIDGATGAVTVNPETTFTHGGEKHLICPNSNEIGRAHV